MGNAIDKIINKGPPLSPKCVPKCTPGPNDLRSNICYKGECVPLCPIDSTALEDGNCLCNEDNYVYKDDNSKMNNDPSSGDGWGYCDEESEESEELDKIELNKRELEETEKKLQEEIQKNPDISEEEKVILKTKIKKKIKKKKKKKKKTSPFSPISLFTDRTPKELDERVKIIVKDELKRNPKMSDEELAQLISETTLAVVEELAIECEEEYKITKKILSKNYGNGKWPTQEELKVLIDTKNFPWLKSQVNQWPEERSITTCQILSTVKDRIKLNNRCIYSDDYPNTKEDCNVSCGLGTEIREKSIVRKSNPDFPSLQPCSGDVPSKEFECDSGLICKKDCALQVNMQSFGEAKCSKPCDSGDGPGEKTYKIKYLEASQGEYGDRGSCELDEEGKVEGEEYDITVDCNKDPCPDCAIKSKGPYNEGIVDYTGSMIINGQNKTFTKCLLPKKDGTFKNVDCGGAEGGYNYNKGARSKYNVTYNITKDDYDVQNCTKGEDIIEEGCSVNAFEPNLDPIVGENGKLVKGGGEECGNECILSDDYPQVVMVEGKECSKECGGGLQKMRKVVKTKSDAPYCPCKDDPNKCPFEMVDCNTEGCISPCVYANNGKHVQINDRCPGVEGPNKHIEWDTSKPNSSGGTGMWYDSIKNKYYEKNNFVKKFRVPTKKPPVGGGACYDGDKADRVQPCSIDGTEKPVDAVWGPWEFDYITGTGETVKTITEKHSKWTFPKINIVKVGSTQVGLTVTGSGKINWPSGGINEAVKEVKQMGHTLGKTVHYIEKRRNQIWLYKKGNASGTTGADTWEFQKGEEQNPNKGLYDQHCISEEGLSIAFEEEMPGRRFTRKVTVFPEFGGRPPEEIDGGHDRKIEPYMKKADGSYTKYCPIDAGLNPELPIDDIEITGSLGNQDRCYITADNAAGKGRGKYTIEELEEEAKRKFVRDGSLPKYPEIARANESRILGPGTRTIYRSKVRDETTPEKYGGLTTGLWHTKENFGDVRYDRRKNEYENCDGVADIIEEIRTRKKNNEECNNEDCWKANSLVIQEDCVPVYDWDGKFYKDRASAEAGLTGSAAEEIVKPSQGDSNAVSHITDKEPGTYVHKRGKFIMSSVYNTSDWTTASLDGDYGWLAKNNRRSNPGWLQMETETGGKELIKGVVTKGYDSSHYVKKFKVYVSRNGDSWKQMKNSSGSFDFTGSHSSEEKHYFEHTVEAKYIRFYPDGQSSGPWPSLQAGYIRDKSGVVNCKLGDGILQGEPFFRFTFNEAKTREKDLGGKYSSGTAATTKKCPKDGESWEIQKGEMPDFGPGGIPKGDIWVLRKNSTGDDYLEPIEDEMSKKMLYGCGTDPSYSAWWSKESGGTKHKWSVCHQTKNDGTEDEGNEAFSTSDGGYMFMYRRWDATQSSNDAIYGPDKGYKKLASGFNDYIDNTYNSNASSNGSTYDQQVHTNTNFKNFDYNTVNIVRQPCNRGTTAVMPTLGTKWESTIPAAPGQTSGWKGTIWNYSGGTEGWLDQDQKLTWDNAFKGRAHALLANKGSGEVFPDIKVHPYLVEEKEGVTNSNNNAAYSSDYRGASNTKIGGNHAWICNSSENWSTSLDNPKSRAEYTVGTSEPTFMPVGIRIQPRKPSSSSSWAKYMPAKIKLDWISGSQEVTLGEFADEDTVKTILINPNDRKATREFYVYARHGNNIHLTGFRINFLVGKIGGGYSQDKGAESNNNANEPTPCKDGGAGVTDSDLVKDESRSVTTTYGDYVSAGECNKNCGWTGTRPMVGKKWISTPMKYTKVQATYGGKNNCTDTVAPAAVVDPPHNKNAPCNRRMCCDYQWQNKAFKVDQVGGSSGSEVAAWSGHNWGKQHKWCWQWCKDNSSCTLFQISGGYCYRYKEGTWASTGTDTFKMLDSGEDKYDAPCDCVKRYSHPNGDSHAGKHCEQ